MTREEEEWLRLLRSSPEEGMMRVIDAYAPAVKTICTNILRSAGSTLVDDAMEESFIRLWEHVREGKKVHASLKSYLYQIARNVSLDMLRKYKRDRHMSLDVPEEGWGIEEILREEMPSTEDAFFWKQRENKLHQAVAAMEEPDRSIFLLRYFYFYKVRQIAEMLELKEDNVESRIRRGLKKLQKSLSEQGVTLEC